MENISSTTINFLETIYNTVENNVKQAIGLQSFFQGPFPFSVTDRTINVFQQFLIDGKFTTRLGTKGAAREDISFDLSRSPKEMFAWDPNDLLLTGLINSSINLLVVNSNRGYELELGAKVKQLYKYSHSDVLTEASTDAVVRKHFYDNYLFLNYENEDFWTTDTGGKKVQKFRNGASLATIANALISAMKVRLNSWINIKLAVIQNPPIPAKLALIKAEKQILSEVNQFTTESIRVEESTGLRDFISKIINPDENTSLVSMVDRFEYDVYRRAFGSDDPTDSQKKYFSQVFKGSNIELASRTQERQFTALISQMEETGLLALARYANTISEFARTRFSSVEQVKRSAIDSIKVERDLAWLGQLNIVLQKISRNPITLATINIYFPSLVSFFFDALALTGDYSNNGKGGGEEDTLNNLDDFMDSLEKAFGRTVDFEGNDLKGSIFKLAARYENTAKKMKAALEASPYRANIQPKSPDIFHLRLGASNFYVPPLTIDVNTSFKAGSLTGGAIRQKSSPKFNSGYKETSIRMKLFFPNYQEIWGISIDDASKISLNDNYQIDFRNRRV
jgi:hypothetical protein